VFWYIIEGGELQKQHFVDYRKVRFRMKAARVGYLLVFLCALFALQAQAAGDTKVFTARFSEADLRTEQQYLAGSDYDIVRLRDLDVIRTPGVPCLPVEILHIYVPRGKEISGIRVDSVEQVPLSGEYVLLPGQHEVPYSSQTIPDPVAPDPSVYSMREQYPASPVDLSSTGSMAGRKISDIRVFPIQYIPAEGRLLLNHEITFAVEFVDADMESPYPAETRSVRNLRNQVVEELVENTVDLEYDFPTGAGTLDPAVATEYLLLCHENHVDEYQALKDWKIRKGVPAAIVTIQDVYDTYPGRDDAEKLRNCIQDYYLNQSTAWVVLTLSSPKAAIRGCYCRVGGTVDAGIPCDLYFADMDGDWNDDDDAIWGETDDDVDLYPDVWVGRLPANTGLQVEPIVEKVLTYEGYYPLPSDYQLEMLFLAEYADASTDGAVSKNMIDSESVPPRFDPITKLYQSSGNLNYTSAMNALNAGMGLVNHDGHGNSSVLSIGPNALYTEDMLSLTNGPRYSVFYTVACLPGNFGNVMGCFARGFLESEEGGGFFVGNSRYGWYWPGNPGYGTGDLYDREFFESMFVRDKTHLGIVHADAKIQRIAYSGSNNTDRWTQFTSNLFGDPETPVWKDVPLELAASHPGSLMIGNHMITVSVSSDGSPIEGARVCLWKGDDLYMVDETGGGGTAQFEISVMDTGNVLVTVTKNAYLPYLGNIRAEGDVSGITDGNLPSKPLLSVNPNPVTGTAAIAFSLPGSDGRDAATEAVISIYDASGRLVDRISEIDGESTGSVIWDARSGNGSPVPSGIYFAKLTSRHKSTSTKFVILR
jgi:hypothetical protein